MKKNYNNKEMTTETREVVAVQKNIYFFPKETPPVSVEADTTEEAERKLAELKQKDNE